MKTKFLTLCAAGFALVAILATTDVGGWLAKAIPLSNEPPAITAATEPKISAQTRLSRDEPKVREFQFSSDNVRIGFVEPSEWRNELRPETKH